MNTGGRKAIEVKLKNSIELLMILAKDVTRYV